MSTLTTNRKPKGVDQRRMAIDLKFVLEDVSNVHLGPDQRSKLFFQYRQVSNINTRKRIVFRALGDNVNCSPYLGWKHFGGIKNETTKGCITCSKAVPRGLSMQVFHSMETSHGIAICDPCAFAGDQNPYNACVLGK